MSTRGSDFLADLRGIEALFGHAARFYVPLLRQIIPRVFGAEYDFKDKQTHEQKLGNRVYGTREGNRVYWRDFLFHAHLVVSASLYLRGASESGRDRFKSCICPTQLLEYRY